MERSKRERNCIYRMLGFSFVSCLLTFMLIGCLGSGARTPTLVEMNRWQTRDFSSEQLQSFLDRSYASEQDRRDFWAPMMDRLVGEWSEYSGNELWIPMEHLKKAINNYNQTAQYERQEDAVYIYYWQIYSNVDVRKELYGFPQDWKRGNEGSARAYLRVYMPMLFDRYQGDGNFGKLIGLVKQHDYKLVEDLFMSKKP